jgi:hypothetical protein
MRPALAPLVWIAPVSAGCAELWCLDERGSSGDAQADRRCVQAERSTGAERCRIDAEALPPHERDRAYQRCMDRR